MELSRQRRFVTPEPGDTWETLARRALPGEPADAAADRLRSWNLQLFARITPGEFLGSDVIFVEPPLAGGEPAPATDG